MSNAAHASRLLEGQVALVTGGTAGIGYAIAERLLGHGAKVWIVGKNVEKGESAYQRLAATHGERAVRFYSADVASKDAIDTLCTKLLEEDKGIDILVHNAGITCDGLLLRFSDADWQRVLDVNLTSGFYLCRTLIRPMLKARKGKILLISSIVGLIGNAGQTAYAASKAGMIGFAKSLARELASRGICVNCLAPGFIDTDMTRVLSDTSKVDICAKIPLGRIGTAEEVADAALFLTSPYANYITGQTLVVDGGMGM